MKTGQEGIEGRGEAGGGGRGEDKIKWGQEIGRGAVDASVWRRLRRIGAFVDC